MSGRTQASGRRRQTGATAVEFALLTLVTMMFLYGIVDIGRIMFIMNSASEATRMAARVAAVCNVSEAGVRDRTAAVYPIFSPDNFVISYQPAGCIAETCQAVSASLAQGDNGVSLTSLVPGVSAVLAIPAFTTTLRRESLNSATSGGLCN